MRKACGSLVGNPMPGNWDFAEIMTEDNALIRLEPDIRIR